MHGSYFVLFRGLYLGVQKILGSGKFNTIFCAHIADITPHH